MERGYMGASPHQGEAGDVRRFDHAHVHARAAPSFRLFPQERVCALDDSFGDSGR